VRRAGPGNRFAIALTFLLIVSGAAVADEDAGPPRRPLAGFVFGVGRVLSRHAPDPPGMNWGPGIAIDYEWSHARVGGTLFLGWGGSWSNTTLRFSADWLPLSGDWSPYFGAGAGFAIIGKKRDYEPNGEELLPPYLNGLPMLSVEAGAELFRTRRMRLLLGVDLEMPWSRPYQCSADLTSCGEVWSLRYPEVSFQARMLF